MKWKLNSISVLMLTLLLFSCSMGLVNNPKKELDAGIPEILEKIPANRGINDNLINKYDFNNSLAPVTVPNPGNTFIPVGLPITYSNSATGQSVKLTNTSLLLPNSALYNIDVDTFSVSLWIKTTQNNVNVLKKHDGIKGYSIFINPNGNLTAVVSDGGNTLTVTGSDSVTTGAWTLATLVYWRSAYGMDFLFLYTNENSSIAYNFVNLGDLTNNAPLIVSSNVFIGEIETLRFNGSLLQSPDITTLFTTENPTIAPTPTPTPALTTVTINRATEYTGLIYYNKNTYAYSSYSAAAYPNSEGDLTEGTSYYNDTHGYAGFSLSSIPAGSNIIRARVYYTTYFPAPDPKGNCTLYKGEQHADISDFLATDYANNGWGTVYANMTPVNNDTQMMSNYLNQEGLNNLTQAYTNNTIFTVGFRQQTGTRSRFANNKIYIEVQYSH